MRISVVDPISPAIERTKRVLFQPFDVTKWLTLGFCAFLAQLGEGGSPNYSGNFGGSGSGTDDIDWDPVWEWIQEHLTLIISAVVGLFVVGCLFSLLLSWLSSRGKFMLIDGIVKNRGAVIEPWHEYRQEGNSLFCFRFLFGVCCFLVFAIIVGGCILIAMPSIEQREFGGSAILALAIGIPSLILFSIGAALISFSLVHFVVPTMYLRRMRVMAAWDEFRYRILAGRIGTFLLYCVFQIVIQLGVSMLAFAATCMTCCITLIPYVGSVILLPLFIFARSYNLYFGSKRTNVPDVAPRGVQVQLRRRVRAICGSRR